MILTQYFVYITGDCTAGYLCISGSSTPTPTDGVTGDWCPVGYYCETGTPTATPCPAGTQANVTGLTSSSECPACQGGYYCGSSGLSEPTAPCQAGYYCISGASIDNPTNSPTGDECTVGHYCPTGTAVPIQCDPGTYAPNAQASVCINCTAGYYCTDGLTLVNCPLGNYCPSGTGNVYEQCPVGTYGSATNLASAGDCTQCTGGSYCDTPGATGTAGTCTAGYFCTSGSDSATPSGAIGDAGICPAGSYCPSATVNPQPCQTGYYSNTTGLTANTECTLCDYGKYCTSTGLMEPEGDCDPGFYCLQGATVPNNAVEDSTGGPCPIGYYCPGGTSLPLGCVAGTYRYVI